MLKGKRLYDAARSFTEDQLVPSLNNDDLTEEAKDDMVNDATLLGVALLVDVAESLHKIATKVG